MVSLGHNTLNIIMSFFPRLNLLLSRMDEVLASGDMIADGEYSVFFLALCFILFYFIFQFLYVRFHKAK